MSAPREESGRDGVVIAFAPRTGRRRAASPVVSADEAAFRRQTGCRIRVSRMSGGLSQAELARASGLSAVAVRRLEDGAVAVDAWHLSLIADALNVTMSGLAGRRDVW